MQKSDIEIARQANALPIEDIAENLKIPDNYVKPYGHSKAKIDLEYIDSLQNKPDGKLILVTAISPTPAGEGKTTTAVGLGDALNRIGKQTSICLREPSLGPCFGAKGGAAGGGYAQVIPMEDINLHFTGDFHAIGVANNLLAAMIDNHIYWGNKLELDERRITWKRAVDMNDRSLRSIIGSLGGVTNGFPREDGFDITVASEVMAIFCLAENISDLQDRLGNIIVGYTRKREAIYARQLEAHGAMTTLLRDALSPNLVQTLENNPAFIHGGPFANIAHGCNSVLATKLALKLSDYVVTEAGFGADLGAEKFINIKCRKAGLSPSAVALVATVRALKMHGGVSKDNLEAENLDAVKKGIANLTRHIENIRSFGLPVTVGINQFPSDTKDEMDLILQSCSELGVPANICQHWEKGGEGAVKLAESIVKLAEDHDPKQFHYLYEDDLPLWDKVETVARSIYGAKKIIADKKIRNQFRDLQETGFGHFPVCMAKTQYSFSTDPLLLGAPSNHVVPIREVRLSAGAEFIVVVCGEIMTMPGLPRKPSAESIHINSDGEIEGLF